MSACRIGAAPVAGLWCGVGVPPGGLRVLQGAGECGFPGLRTGSSTAAPGPRVRADVFVPVGDTEGNRLSLSFASPCNPFLFFHSI